MAGKVKYGNTLISSRADETLTYTKYVKDEATGKSAQELIDEKVSKTDELDPDQIKDGAITLEKLAEGVLDSKNISHNGDSNIHDEIEDLELNKFDKSKISQSPGNGEDCVMSQKAVTEEIRKAIIMLGDSFVLSIQSSKGIFFSPSMVGRMDSDGNYITFTTLSVKGYWYNNNVTDELFNIVWTRESDYPEDDKVWNMTHKNVGKNLPLNFLDIGGSKYKIGSIIFKCEAEYTSTLNEKMMATQIINL